MFFTKKNKQSFGFSLIEMVVVVGSVGIIIVAVISTIILTFRSQNMVKSKNKINENARNIIYELRRLVFSGGSQQIVCGTGNSSVLVTNVFDKQETILSCVGGNIASSSAKIVNLNTSEVTVFGCQNFVVCEDNTGLTEDIGVTVSFNFGLSASTNGVGTSQMFNTWVSTRN